MASTLAFTMAPVTAQALSAKQVDRAVRTVAKKYISSIACDTDMPYKVAALEPYRVESRNNLTGGRYAVIW